ncbi:hypothetical protein ACFYSC_12140 [Streptosporangium sp. NPDC004379]|uniref:hypothetical protein n=1 Tax=Streptosporangium sp. NPDC004379 TaxID=3366189 RepID=UPI0036A80CB7
MIPSFPNRRAPGGRRARVLSRRVALLAQTVVLAAGLVALFPAGADAAAPNGCGGSFALLKTWPIRYQGTEAGGIDVYYSGATGQNCVIVRPNAGYPHGTFDRIQAGLRRSGTSHWEWDGYNANLTSSPSNYTYYAGPVYVYAKGSCIDFYGEMRFVGRRHAGKSTLMGRIGAAFSDRAMDYQMNRHCA